SAAALHFSTGIHSHSLQQDEKEKGSCHKPPHGRAARVLRKEGQTFPALRSVLLVGSAVLPILGRRLVAVKTLVELRPERLEVVGGALLVLPVLHAGSFTIR